MISGPEAASRINKFIHSSTEHIHPVVFTSQMAVNSFVSLLKETDFETDQAWQVFCTAPKTLETVQAGLPNVKVIAIAENASLLAEEIKNHPLKKVSFFCGNRRRDELIVVLGTAGLTVDEYVIYNTNLSPVRIQEHYDGVMFFSPSGVESFLDVNPFNPEKEYFAIGATTAESFFNNTTSMPITPIAPSTEEMMKLVCTHYHTSKSKKG